MPSSHELYAFCMCHVVAILGIHVNSHIWGSVMLCHEIDVKCCLHDSAMVEHTLECRLFCSMQACLPICICGRLAVQPALQCECTICVLGCCTMRLSMPKQTGCCLWAGNCNMCVAIFVAHAQCLWLGKWHARPARLCAYMVTSCKCHL